ncbi:hypothetical protein [Paraburkholderia kururiensis]|uniref:Uncharacterized protein n=1 Tax=Paraburkholderia kururiensis TaxID=984307 RepID=A0ABZ0WV65_9BURK|nr:hypothetical protein [Paraburkholderia kururiensis]WQD81262.1 hypothetical protein U0042_29935 [Paraburkholderia kururiensis]
MTKPTAPEELLDELAQVKPQGKTARLRLLFDRIEALQQQGHLQSEILEKLNSADPPLNMKLSAFRTVLTRLRKERQEQGQDQKPKVRRASAATEPTASNTPGPMAQEGEPPSAESDESVRERLRKTVIADERSPELNQYFNTTGKKPIGGKIK